MRGEGVAVSEGQKLLEALDLLIKNFNILIAALADEVIVMIVPEADLKAGVAIAEIHFLGYSCGGKQTQGAVDGGLPYFHVFALEIIIELFRRIMFVALKEMFNNFPSLGGVLERIFGQIFCEFL